MMYQLLSPVVKDAQGMRMAFAELRHEPGDVPMLALNACMK